jgi:hypothetical protein
MTQQHPKESWYEGADMNERCLWNQKMMAVNIAPGFAHRNRGKPQNNS